jgi:hypothetical protein
MWASASLLSLTLFLGRAPAPVDEPPAQSTEVALQAVGEAPSPAEQPPSEQTPSEQPPGEQPPGEQPPVEQPGEVAPAEAPPTESPSADAPPATATFPEAPAGEPSAVSDEPAAAAEPRTWNDPEAAAAAAAATPTEPGPTAVDDELGDDPLPPLTTAKDPKGFGMAMLGAITFSPQSGHAWAEGGCPVATITVNGTTQIFAPGCSATPAAGISAEGRFGYMLSFIGFELYGQIATDYVNAQLDSIPAIPGVPEYATQMHIGRIGIGGGGHVRFKTPPGSFRLSAGAGGGFLVRALFTNVSSLDGSSENYVAPVLRADVGIVVVNALTLGVMGWIEFAPTVTVTPDLSALGGAGAPLQGALTETVVMRGTQGFIGLFGGFAFGK